MEILFATTELSPYVRASGLADVAAALPKTLKTFGHRVTVVIPRYPSFEEAGLLVARRLTPLRVELGERAFDVTIYDGRLSSQVDLVLLEVPGLEVPGSSERPESRDDGKDHADNATRFAVFSRAVAELVRQRQESTAPFDVVHVSDWPTALVAKYLKDLGVSTPSLLTIHDGTTQGLFPKETLAALGVVDAGANGSVNVLEQGVLAADAVTTVSPGYAIALRSEKAGAHLGRLLEDKARVTGIAPGIDYGVWNPATDSHLAARYDAEDTSNKGRCRGALRRELGLPFDVEAPLVLHVGPLSERHGSDLVAAILARILRGSDSQVVVAGDGDAALVATFEAAVARGHGRAAFVRAPVDGLVHRLFAAADIVLLPHRGETNDFTHLRAQRYGALPVAFRTGSLADAIVDVDAKLETGTGFLFDEADEASFYGAVSRAIAAWASPAWPSLRRRVMKLDRSWERTARQYEQAYKAIASSAS